MKTQLLTGKKVAILATDGFEQNELLSPLEALRGVGADACPNEAHWQALIRILRLDSQTTAG